MKSGKLFWFTIIVAELMVLCVAYFVYNRRESVEFNYTQDDLLYSNGESGFYLDNSYDYSYIATPDITLPKGLYTLEVQYEYSRSAAVAVNAIYSTGSYDSDAAGKIILTNPNVTTSDFRIKYAQRPIKIRGRLTGDAGEGDYLLIRNIRVITSACSMRNFLFQIFIFLLIVDILLLVYIKRDKFCLSGENGTHFKILLVLVFLSSLPLMVNYLLSNAHDMTFHLVRIEGLKEGLKSGMFPVRIQPSWLEGHGYAVSVFYGDLFLYIPAILRIFGVSVQTVYKLYIVFVNCLTVFLSYHCFSKMSNRRTGLACTVLYSLNIYRLLCIYTRGAVGEYSAMAFLPLVLYGFWKLYMLPEDTREHDRSWITITVGCSGVFLSHTISTELVAIFIIITVVILWKKTFRKNNFLTLTKAAAATVLLNLWFLVPFLDYIMNGTFQVNAPTPYVPYHNEERGAFPAQFFMLDYAVDGISNSVDRGSKSEIPITVGIALMLVLVFWFVFCFLKKERNTEERKRDFLPVFLSILSLWMATYLFPYTWLIDKLPVLSLVVKSTQYPWRLLSIASIAITWLFCLIMQKDWIGRKERNIFALLLISISFLQSLSYMSKCLNSVELVKIYQDGNLSNDSISGGEYIPLNWDEGYDRSKYVNELTYNAGEILVSEWHRDDYAVVVSLTNTTDRESKVEVPLLLYKGYHAYADTGEELAIIPGESYRASVAVPGGFDGSITVRFREPWYWRVCEVISLLTLIAISVSEIIKNMKERQK